MSHSLREELGITGRIPFILNAYSSLFSVPLEKLEACSDIDYMRLHRSFFNTASDLESAYKEAKDGDS